MGPLALASGCMRYTQNRTGSPPTMTTRCPRTRASNSVSRIQRTRLRLRLDVPALGATVSYRWLRQIDVINGAATLRIASIPGIAIVVIGQRPRNTHKLTTNRQINRRKTLPLSSLNRHTRVFRLLHHGHLTGRICRAAHPCVSTCRFETIDDAQKNGMAWSGRRFDRPSSARSMIGTSRPLRLRR
ncbi:hypothetical protein CERSUDRAFT_125869, partial [Gelatoporia subvermispora B]